MGSAVEHLDCQRFPKMVDKEPSIWKTFEQQAAKWAQNSCSKKTICFVAAKNSPGNFILFLAVVNFIQCDFIFTYKN